MFPEVTIGLVCPYNVAFGEEYWTSNKRSSRCGRLTLHPKLQDHATINIGVRMAGSYVKPIPREEVETYFPFRHPSQHTGTQLQKGGTVRAFMFLST